MSATLHRLSSTDGFSLEIPDSMQEAAELETGPVSLVARAEPWSMPDEFRPNLTAEVAALAGDRCTIPQLSALAIAGQIALGAHVAACDMWREVDDEHGRRIISIYPAMDTTVVQRQYVTIRGGRAVIVGVQCGADHYSYGQAVFRGAVASIRCEFDDPVPDPDPDTMPRLDPFAKERGHELEYLGAVRAAQPFKSAGPPLDDAQLDALRRGKLRRSTDTEALEAGGLVDARGKLTGMGQAAHRAFSAPARQVGIEVVSDGDPRVAELRAFQRSDSTVVVTGAPFGSTGSRRTLDVVPSRTTPVALARWLGLAPAWTFGIHEDTSPLRIDSAVLDARLGSPESPPPAGADAALVRMWTQPWQVARLNADPHPPQVGTVITTPESGSFRIDRDQSGEPHMTPLPSAQLLAELLRLGGFALADG